MLLFLLFASLTYVTAQDSPVLVFSGGKNFIGKGVFQFEYGGNFERTEENSAGVNQQVSQFGLLRYGIRKGLDFSISYNYAKVLSFVSDQMRRANGLTTFSAGFKGKLADNYSLQSNFGFSKNQRAKVEGGAQIFGISEYQLDSFLAWENNLGLSWAKGQPQAQLMYLTGLTFTMPYPLDVILEFYGQYGDAVRNNYGNIGLGFYFNADLMLEAYGGYGSTDKLESFFLSLNVYWRLLPSPKKADL